MLQATSKFGLTPSSRSRIIAGNSKTKEPEDEMEKKEIKISKDKLLDELNGIYDGWVIQSITEKMSFTRVLGEMTKEQKELWEVVSKIDLYAPREEI